mmetsp:Transcript_11824/g.28224  ORF Transcript_11824/g.28224 Transcript_11824/m.28224 type:complete len:201 (+) Transcript_11824:1261-1863(+)
MFLGHHSHIHAGTLRNRTCWSCMRDTSLLKSLRSRARIRRPSTELYTVGMSLDAHCRIHLKSTPKDMSEIGIPSKHRKRLHSSATECGTEMLRNLTKASKESRILHSVRTGDRFFRKRRILPDPWFRVGTLSRPCTVLSHPTHCIGRCRRRDSRVRCHVSDKHHKLKPVMGSCRSFQNLSLPLRHAHPAMPDVCWNCWKP